MTGLSAEGGDDDFFDGYDDFLSNLDFNDKGWNPDNPIGGSGGNGGNRRQSNYNGGGGNRSRGGSRGYGGGGGGGHDYERAQDDDVSFHIDESKVNTLIAQRLAHRKRGEFDQADDIRDALKQELGVTLWDKERIWTTNADRRGGSNRHSNNGRYGRDNNRRGGGGGDRRGGGGRRERKARDFGPTGHDYSMTGDGIDPSICSLPISDIDALLAERLQAKMSRDFRTADEIQNHLRSQGVNVMDGMKEWRADGLEWERSQRPQGRDNNGFSNIRQYTRRGVCKGIPEDEVMEITNQIQKRSEYKAERDYDNADQIKFDLSEKYDIIIDDRMLTWAVRNEEYMLSQDSEVIPDEETLETIGNEFRLRIIAKQNKDFDAADAIRDELYEKYGVLVLDRLKEFTIERRGDNSFSSEEDATGTDTDWEVDASVVDDSVVEDIPEDTAVEEEEEEEVVGEFKVVSEEDLQALTIPLLKDKLREAGLPVSGKKAELIERLLSN